MGLGGRSGQPGEGTMKRKLLAVERCQYRATAQNVGPVRTIQRRGPDIGLIIVGGECRCAEGCAEDRQDEWRRRKSQNHDAPPSNTLPAWPFGLQFQPTIRFFRVPGPVSIKGGTKKGARLARPSLPRQFE